MKEMTLPGAWNKRDASGVYSPFCNDTIAVTYYYNRKTGLCKARKPTISCHFLRSYRTAWNDMDARV